MKRKAKSFEDITYNLKVETVYNRGNNFREIDFESCLLLIGYLEQIYL